MMEYIRIIFLLFLCGYICNGAKINTPRVLLPWFEETTANFTFEISDGGCYKWTLSRDDIIDLEALYDDAWGHCSRAARVSVSKTCVPPGSVIILAEEVNTGEILRGDVDIDKISSLEVMSTTWKLYLEEAPEAFEVVAYDDQGNKFSTLDGLVFTWTIENLGSYAGDELLVILVHWKDTDYEAPPGVAELEARGLRSYSTLLYGQAMGQCRVTVCLGQICTDFNLHVVASVVLTPATALIAPGDTLRYRVVRARAGRLTIQDISDTLYYLKVPHTDIAQLEDSVSLVRGSEIGTTTVVLYSGSTEVAAATLTVVEPYNIRVTLRPHNLLIKGEPFLVHCVLLDQAGHPLTSGDEILIRLSVDGEANVELLKSTENGTVTDAVAYHSGPFIVTARLHSVAGKIITRKVEGQVTAFVIEPLQIVPPELFVAWTDNIQELTLKYVGGGDEPVIWSKMEDKHAPFTIDPSGLLTVRGEGDILVKVHLEKYPHVQAVGRVWSSQPELIQLSTSGFARVGRPHHLHIAVTATHPETGELYNFHVCNCASFALSLLEGPEPHNVTAASWVTPVDGACCVLETVFTTRGISHVRASRGRSGASARVSVRAVPRLLWPAHAACLGSVPVLAEGEALTPKSSEPRIVELSARDGPPPHRYPDIQLFTLKCRKKGEARVQLLSHTEEEPESVELETSCATHVSRIRLEPSDASGNCSGGPKIWLRPGQEVTIRVTLLDTIGRELLDERGPKVSWESEPKQAGIEYRSTDRLFIETHPEYAPVPVPYRYYQLVIADERAVGWSGTIKATIPDATASIQAIVVAPLVCNPLKVDIAWEGDTIPDIITVTGGSGRYAVESSKGVSSTIENGSLSLTVPGPGSYDLLVTDLCVPGERQIVEVYIEEVLSVEVSTSRAVGVGSCVPISALVQGVSHRYLTTSKEPEWRWSGDVIVKHDSLCGVREGSGRVRAALAGVWSPEVEVFVFPPLEIVPARASLPPGARLQLRHHGGPPHHLAALHYTLLHPRDTIEVSSSGAVHGMAIGTAKVKLVALDADGIEMASAASEVEVVPISGLRVRASTQTLIVGETAAVWIEAGTLSPTALASLHPPPRVAFSLRDPTVARLYTTHLDDKLDRSVVEGLSVRVVPLKAGVIAIDVRVRNLGQVAETRSWDSTIEILGISDIRTSVEGLPGDLSSRDRLAIAVGSTIRLKSLPRSSWKAYDNGAFEVTPNGEVKALKPGHGVVIAQHKDERNSIYRESVIHIEVEMPSYCTAEATASRNIRVVVRGQRGRALLAPAAAAGAAPLPATLDKQHDSVLGPELVIEGLDPSGMFMKFEATVGGVTVTDEVWVSGTDAKTDKIVLTGGWGACVEGVGWRGTAGLSLAAGSGVTLALAAAAADTVARHTLRHERTHAAVALMQLPVHKMEFVPGEWPPSLVPLSIEALGLSSGPLLCTEEQRYALEGVQVELPYTCRTQLPHNAEPVLDIINGQIGCKIIPATQITEVIELDLCGEWGVFRTCTKVALLPPIQVSQTKVSLLNQPAVFTIVGHARALKLTKLTASPGLKLDIHTSPGETTVSVTNEASTCGLGWVTVTSRLTSQEIRVDVERECGVACGSILGALLSLITPYFSTLITLAGVAAAYHYIQARVQSKTSVNIPVSPPVLPASPPARSRTWSRSPYAAAGPSVPVYGDTSTLPDSSFSPTSSRTHSRFL